MASISPTAEVYRCPPRKITQYDFQAFGNSDVVIARAAQILSVSGVNKSASALWVMLFDAAAVPSNGAVPIVAPIPALAGARFSADLADRVGDGVAGIGVTNGIVWAVSTLASPSALTIDATNSVWLSARYL